MNKELDIYHELRNQDFKKNLDRIFGLEKLEQKLDELNKPLPPLYNMEIDIECHQLLQFGSPTIQNLLKKMCKEANYNFEEFKDKIVENSGKNNYAELNEYWIGLIPCDEKDIKHLPIVNLKNVMIINLDWDTKDFVVMLMDDYLCCGGEDNTYYQEIYWSSILA